MEALLDLCLIYCCEVLIISSLQKVVSLTDFRIYENKKRRTCWFLPGFFDERKKEEHKSWCFVGSRSLLEFRTDEEINRKETTTLY